MEQINLNLVEKSDDFPRPKVLNVAVALSGSRKSKYVVKWALEKFVSEEHVYFKLLHIRPVISQIPTPMGNYIPIYGVREDVVAAFRKDVEDQINEKLLPYKKMCFQRKVRVEIVQIESDDVVAAIASEIRKHKMDKLVIGVSSRRFFRRTLGLSSKISEGCPSSCTVYATSKGKLSSLRPSEFEMNRGFTDESSDLNFFNGSSLSNSWTSQTDSICEGSSIGSFAQFRSSSTPLQHVQSLSKMNQILVHKRVSTSGVTNPRNLTLATVEEPNDANVSSIRHLVAGNPLAPSSNSSTKNQVNVDMEVEKLRIRLKHVRGMYAMAQSEVIETSRKLNELQERRLKEEIKLKQVSFMEEEAEELARLENERYVAAIEEADCTNKHAEREAERRKMAEIRASNAAREKAKLETALTGGFCKYRKFTWEEIVSATSSFSEDLKIGSGAYGSVYKGCFHQTTIAVKIFHCKEASRIKLFQQEVEILSQIRHPHLLSMVGACADHACLVYEFMENGSLDDILFKKHNSPPLLWFDRYRIAWEVATALAVLHNSKPKAIVHRDLKPANILLDRNYISRIGDVGISTMMSEDSLSVSRYKDTAVVGTLCYIDPEYQRTGLVSPKSDVYAFGMVILQLLTARSARALAPMVEMEMANSRFIEMLDQEGGAWPVEETKELALIGLKCTELRGRDRPDLCNDILPALARLKQVSPRPPDHFICPILKERMMHPFIAADGYTYEREAIEAWIKENDMSPITGSILAHKSLTPNHNLVSAIMEWNSGKH